MKKFVKFVWTSLFSLCATGLLMGNSAAVTTAGDFDCTYSAGARDTEYMCYGSSTVNTYTAAEAAAKGIPEGYENEVLEVLPLNGEVNCGTLLDFSAKQIPLTLIDGLEFRVYIEANTANTGGKPQVRIAEPYALNNRWVYQPGSTPTPAGEWTTVTVPCVESFSTICTDGMLNKFELSVRTNARVAFYVDSIRCVLKENDGVAPVITYTGADEISVGLGKPFSLPVSATDVQEGEMAVQYLWGDGVALDGNGTPTKTGRYTLTLKAEDYYGNVAQKTITVNVVDEDKDAPVIALNYTQVKTTVGTKPMLKVTATDESGAATVKTAWSAGALDNRGRLTAGVHIWTVTATDLFGNAATKQVTFTVTEDEPAYDFVTNEENRVEKYTVTFDGENPMEIAEGLKLQRPADPVKEATAEATYQFLGWYVGDVEWDFENGVVTQNMDIVSKWKVTQRIYRVYFDEIRYKEYLPYGSLIPEDALPATPRKDSTVMYDYTFDGWYNGETKWDFATDVITGETRLTAKFTESLRTFTVTFDGENAGVYTYGDKLTAPDMEDIMDGAGNAEGIFDGWYYGSKKWDFENDVVKSDMDLQSQWKNIALDSTEDSTSQPPDSNDMAQPGGLGGIVSGCMATVSGAVGCMAALGTAAIALLKKKED